MFECFDDSPNNFANSFRVQWHPLSRHTCSKIHFGAIFVYRNSRIPDRFHVARTISWIRLINMLWHCHRDNRYLSCDRNNLELRPISAGVTCTDSITRYLHFRFWKTYGKSDWESCWNGPARFWNELQLEEILKFLGGEWVAESRRDNLRYFWRFFSFARQPLI